MNIVRPYAKLLNVDLSRSLAVIEGAGRVSHRSEELQTETSTQKFIENVVMKHGDWSIVEHVSASVEFYVDRGITHEIVRHRLFSYTQESTRFVNYEKKMPPSFIYPKPDIVCGYCLEGDQVRFSPSKWGDWLHGPVDSGQFCAYSPLWLNSIATVEEAYKKLLADGWRPQEARSVFPNALASKLIMTGNLRAWRHFFVMRVSKEAHPQMRQVTIPLLEEFRKMVPLLFDDIQPDARQFDNLSKPQ
jgi:thymidylate synthase (FAD)